jgi:hypothetical protein
MSFGTVSPPRDVEETRSDVAAASRQLSQLDDVVEESDVDAALGADGADA